MTNIAAINSYQPIVTRSVFLLTLWFVVALGLALGGATIETPGPVPWVTVSALTVPIVVFLLAYRLLPNFRQLVLGLNMQALVMLHAMRTIGLGFVFLYWYDMLPALFAIPAGIGDAIAAIWALVLGVIMISGRVSQTVLHAWNAFGFVDFVVAISLGVLSRSALLGFDMTSNTDIMGQFPLAIIPGFIVPFYIITHIIIYLQLRANKN